MESVSRILGSHPRVEQADPNVASLIAELSNCESTCVVCVDACLSEQDVQMLARCISLNDTCADVCASTARTAARVGHMEPTILQHQLEACREACMLCADECEQHEHEHCRICSESCRSCAEACSAALRGMMAMA